MNKILATALAVGILLTAVLFLLGPILWTIVMFSRMASGSSSSEIESALILALLFLLHLRGSK